MAVPVLLHCSFMMKNVHHMTSSLMIIQSNDVNILLSMTYFQLVCIIIVVECKQVYCTSILFCFKQGRKKLKQSMARSLHKVSEKACASDKEVKLVCVILKSK